MYTMKRTFRLKYKSGFLLSVDCVNASLNDETVRLQYAVVVLSLAKWKRLVLKALDPLGTEWWDNVYLRDGRRDSNCRRSVSYIIITLWCRMQQATHPFNVQQQWRAMIINMEGVGWCRHVKTCAVVPVHARHTQDTTHRDDVIFDSKQEFHHSDETVALPVESKYNF